MESWCYRGLRPVLAVREVTPHDGIRAGRVLRHCGRFEADVVEVGSAGRFWGYRGLRPVLAAPRSPPRTASAPDGSCVGGIGAKVPPSASTGRASIWLPGRVTYRTTTVRKKLFSTNRGFVTVKDGPAMASQHPVLGAAHPWCPGMQERLVLKEVQVLPRLGRGVVHRTPAVSTVLGRTGELGTTTELQVQIQPGPLRVELGARHPPRLAQPQRRREQPQLVHRLDLFHATVTDGHAVNETIFPPSTRHAGTKPT